MAATKSSQKAHLIISRKMVVFPYNQYVLNIGRARSLEVIKKLRESIREDQAKRKTQSSKQECEKILVVVQKNDTIDKPTINDIYKYGTLCEITKIKELIDSDTGEIAYELTVRGVERIKISTTGLKNVQLEEYTDPIGYSVCKTVSSIKPKDLCDLILKEGLLEDSDELKNISKGDLEVNDWDLISMNLVANANNKIGFNFLSEHNQQSFLELDDVKDRFELYFKLWKKAQSNLKNSERNEEVKQVEKMIELKMKKQLTKQQNEYYLREKLKTIKEELGDITNREDDIDNIRAKVKENPYPKHIKERILTEIDRYESTAPMSQEGNVIKSYLDWLINLPWWQVKENNFEINKVTKTLDDNHYGLAKVKEKIVEYLALAMRSKNAKGPIMCLVGPPGVGKSSLVKSIAEALNKEFVKISLGGVHDESEIRGHRRTYVGSMPGRIIKGMKKAGVTNPLFLLDEIDKMGRSTNHGDPTAALLEVLDPELNNKFNDNYIEEDYDLSNVMFVATANYVEGIPEALYDRMEIIELTSYTENEKLSITKNYLIPRALKEAELTPEELSFTDEGIMHVIKHFTKEAGVRSLERVIKQIVRKFLVAALRDKKLKTQTIGVEEVKHYLKKEIFDYTQKDEVTIPGIVNGMAYTQYGGDLLPIEVSIAQGGKGNVVITGNLKETMKESVNVALGYVKANATEFGIDHEIFQKVDLHVHVPSGGIPKDGPSAGTALTTAIISAFTNKKVSPSVAMTGEITLRGKVLPIGGVKEKTISAHRGGVRKIFLPEKNERYLDEVPKEILKDLEIIPVKQYTEIYKNLFSK
ncbi:endopeptidase La [Mycoplasma bradburyae]|uniref:Lon protease n=1 Tax=Mycoplasma bradburyae TaxID=2963128 RepID=A0AAW6HQA0_9MOLU|nr:endopeptidase La [Mycoplasma bradburyae]MDC4163667.1 endopeptidase La [Mycoplasma bradburyae]MDC4182275.1 endopeptidase La [Mycoplasma bradburyae]MDC4182768.1 endopeptidase La [Mycoplasma bradburyae]MDC4183441.1 endopeptidase La [Mycoplasma bradburyae]MDC4184449.1 endopeptidase La [Mycoplasma bradburyae]